MALLEWANKSDDVNKINYMYSDDNSKELVGRLSVKQVTGYETDESGLIDQGDIISALKKTYQMNY